MYRLFFDYETVRTTRDKLAKLLRTAFYKRQITTDDFIRLHGEYYVRLNLGDQNNPEATDRNNQRRTALHDTISWNKFVFILQDLMRLDIISIAITVKDANGVEIVYSSVDEITPQPRDTSQTHVAHSD